MSLNNDLREFGMKDEFSKKPKTKPNYAPALIFILCVAVIGGFLCYFAFIKPAIITHDQKIMNNSYNSGYLAGVNNTINMIYNIALKNGGVNLETFDNKSIRLLLLGNVTKSQNNTVNG